MGHATGQQAETLEPACPLGAGAGTFRFGLQARLLLGLFGGQQGTDVTHRGNDQPAVFGHQRSEAHLDVEQRPVGALAEHPRPGVQVVADPGRRCTGCAPSGGGTHPLGYEHVDRRAEQFVFVVPEQLLRAGVGDEDPAALVDPR